MTRSIFAATVVAALMSSAPAMAQKLPDGTTVQERADTAKLNAEQLAKADAETARYQQSVSQYEQQKAAIAEQTAAAQAKYADETAAYEAEKARVAAMAAEERQKWEADVAACKASVDRRAGRADRSPHVWRGIMAHSLGAGYEATRLPRLRRSVSRIP